SPVLPPRSTCAFQVPLTSTLAGRLPSSFWAADEDTHSTARPNRTNATRFMMTLLLVGGMRTAGCGRDSEIVGAKTTPPAGARPRSRTAVYGQRPLVWGQIVVYGQSPGRERPQRGTKRHERDQRGVAGPLASGSGRGASFSWIFVPLCGRSLWTLIATS